MSVQGALNLASIEGNGHQKRQQSTSWKLVLDREGWVIVAIQCCRCPQSWRVAWAINLLQPCPSERAKEYIQGSWCNHFDLAWFCQQHGFLVDHVHATFQHH